MPSAVTLHLPFRYRMHEFDTGSGTGDTVVPPEVAQRFVDATGKQCATGPGRSIGARVPR